MGREGLKPPYRCNLHEAPLSPSYKFEKEEGEERLEEEEGEAAPPAMIPGSATAPTEPGGDGARAPAAVPYRPLLLGRARLQLRSSRGR